jgi:CheY-like chemotaxis protein
MSGKRILSVGQCMADHGSISGTLRRLFAAEVVPADSAAEALAELQKHSFDLVLVNRVLDSDGSSGLEVIRQLKTDDRAKDVPVMLVSNYEDAQHQAVQAGALPGFGKSALGQPAMRARLGAVLQR